MHSVRKKKPLTKPFVVTVAHVATAMLAPGCFGIATSNPPPSDIPCPSAMPTQGDACEVTQDCEYGVDSCGMPITASCVNGAWEPQPISFCNPPPPDPQCPPDLPALGSVCTWDWQPGFGCSYSVDIGCGLQTISVLCNPTSVMVEYTAPTCGQCATLTTEAACVTDAACRWLTPGCDMPVLPMAGCFPAADCAGDADCTTAGQTCQQVSYNPCYGKKCDACGAPVSVCLAPPAP